MYPLGLVPIPFCSGDYLPEEELAAALDSVQPGLNRVPEKKTYN